MEQTCLSDILSYSREQNGEDCGRSHFLPAPLASLPPTPRSSLFFLLRLPPSLPLLCISLPVQHLSLKVALRQHRGPARCSTSNKTYCQVPNFKPQYKIVLTGPPPKSLNMIISSEHSLCVSY